MEIDVQRFQVVQSPECSGRYSRRNLYLQVPQVYQPFEVSGADCSRFDSHFAVYPKQLGFGYGLAQADFEILEYLPLHFR